MSSSDDDVAALLPAGRGAAGRGARPGVTPPARLRNFKAMMSDSSSEDEERGKTEKGKDGGAKKPLKSSTAPPSKKGLPEIGANGAKSVTPSGTPTKSSPVPTHVSPTGVSPAVVVLRAAENVAGREEGDDEDETSTNSIQFQEDEKTDDVSMDLHSTMDEATPPRSTAPAPARAHTATAGASGAASGAPSLTKQPSSRTTSRTKPVSSPVATDPQPQPASRALPPAPSASDDGDAPADPARSSHSLHPLPAASAVLPGDDDNDLLREVLPLHPASSAPRGRASAAPAGASSALLQRTRSPTANTSLLHAAPIPETHAIPSPPRPDPLEELLVRAQQRLKEKERLDQSLSQLPSTSAGTAAPPSRTSSPMRPPMPLERRSASAVQGLMEYNTSAPQGPESLTAREIRLQKENQRLSEELAFLSKENQRLRTTEHGPAANELGKAQVHVEVLKQQLRESELEASRTKAYLESQLEDAKQHEAQLKDELRSYSATVAQLEVASREKEARMLELQQQVAKAHSQTQEKSNDVRRAEEEAKRARDDDRIKIERLTQLLDDVKKQRSQLQDLNDKFQKDKEQAIADRRRAAEELRNAQQELQRERERHQDDSAALRRDAERYRHLLSEKDRTLSAQVTEERRAKEHFQARLTELEEHGTAELQQLRESLRAAQDEARAVRDELTAEAVALNEQVRELTLQLESSAAEFATRLQREKSLALKDSADKLQQWKEQRGAAEERRRVAEDALERVSSERDHYRKELEKCIEVNAQWQRAKDKAELQCVQLSASLQQLIAQDEELMQDNERLRNELEQSNQDVGAMRSELDAYFALEQQLQDLSAENDRISQECTRVTSERNELIAENAKLAEEMVRWRNEMKDLFSHKRLQAGSTGTSGFPAVAVRSSTPRFTRSEFSF